jgi:hypothetical protein
MLTIWLQPHCRRLLLIAEKARRKAGCSQDWPPYKTMGGILTISPRQAISASPQGRCLASLFSS